MPTLDFASLGTTPPSRPIAGRIGSLAIEHEVPVIAPPSNMVAALFVLRGWGRYAIAGASVDAGPGSVLWVRSGVQLQRTHVSEGWSTVVASLQEDALRDQAQELAELLDGVPFRLQVIPAQERLRLFALVNDIATQDEASVEVGLAYLLRRLCHQVQHAASTGIGRGGRVLHPTVRRALSVIEQDPRLDLAAIARAVRASPSHLTRLFSSDLGISPGRVREQVRIQRFLEVHSAGQTLMQSALASGFGSYAQFYRVFRRHTGFSPGSYFRELA